MAESDKIVSIITCDTEGRIESFNEHAEKYSDILQMKSLERKEYHYFLRVWLF